MPKNIFRKKTIVRAAFLLCALCAFAACKKITPSDLFQESHTATYMDWHDVRRVAHTLHTAKDRQCVKWQNPVTGYQYSAFVFSSSGANGARQREITLLTRAPSGTGESLDLIGKTNGDGVWQVFARKPATRVGKVSAEQIKPDTSAKGDDKAFSGYPILTE